MAAAKRTKSSTKKKKTKTKTKKAVANARPRAAALPRGASGSASSALHVDHWPRVTAREARRLLMQGLGLLQDPQQKATPRAVRSMIEHMGFVQIDTISAALRAHEHIILTRFAQCEPAGALTQLLERERSMFEHWTHDASIIPTCWYEHWKLRFARYQRNDRIRTWMHQKLGEKPQRVLKMVRQRIDADGPLMSRDFEHNRTRQSDGWWDWKPAKAALEYLWRTGEIAVAGRRNFQKMYDLTERVLPEAHARPQPSETAHIDWACRTALQRLGVATPREIAAFWNAIDARQAAAWCDQQARDGLIEPVIVEHEGAANSNAAVNKDDDLPREHHAWALHDWKKRLANMPEPPGMMRLLSPFDPLVRERERAEQLFGFSYRFEAFVPAAKRQYGYYVMPILQGDALVGRADLKLHRARGEVVVNQVWWEPGIRPTRARRSALEDAVWVLARAGGAKRITLE